MLYKYQFVSCKVYIDIVIRRFLNSFRYSLGSIIYFKYGRQREPSVKALLSPSLSLVRERRNVNMGVKKWK